MSSEQDVFTFDLDESLYFEEGQEVAEMLGVSIDPDISIQPFNDYISIRGVIELHGTYQKEEASDRGENSRQSLEFEDYHSRRYIERVSDLEDGLSEFVHRFPVEISVPSYRVADLNDVTVNIEAFDYEIPNSNQFRLSSTIEIHGIRNNREETSAEENQEDELLPEEDSNFEFDIKSVEEDSPESRSDQLQDYTPVVSLEPDHQEDVEDSKENEGRWKYKKTQTLAEFFDTESSSVMETESEDYVESSHAYAYSEESSESFIGEESRSEERKDVGYLADIFRTKDEEESYTSMKLCIVQEKDTVETIAERYEISPLQLVKQNQLTEDNVEEGQLLYIPYKKRK